MDNSMLEWALRYARLGWRVLPLVVQAKEPLTKNGSTDASADQAQIRAWWGKWPRANVGLATGAPFFVLDVDIKGGGEESFDHLVHQHGRMPDTYEQITGTGGKHILFQMPDFAVRNSTGKLAPGLDIRGIGGYIVAAPSIHPATKRAYLWDGASDLESQPLAAAPSWLLDWLKADLAPKSPPARPVPDKIPSGQRNSTLFKIASSLRRKGLSAAEIFGLLAVTNRTRCAEPLPAAEVQKVADSAARYSPDTRADLFVGGLPEDLPQQEAPLAAGDVEAAIDAAIAANDLVTALRLMPEIAKLRTAARVLIKAKLRQHFGKDFSGRDFDKALHDMVADQRGPPPRPPSDDGTDAPPDGGNLLPYPLTDSGNGERIKVQFGHDIRYCVEMRKWLVWDGRRWAVDANQVIRQKAKIVARLLYAQGVNMQAVERHARESESSAGIVAALACAATEDAIPISAMELDQHPYLLNCLNGVVDLRSGKVLPHDRGYLITKMCHLDYDPEAKCPRFVKFLDWAMGDVNPDSERSERTSRLISFLQRAFGYSLTSDVSEKAAFVFWGPRGNNGKTTLLETFRYILAEYSAQIGIDTLMTTKSQDSAVRADLADLRGARFVTTSEVEKEHRLSEGKLKYITAGMGNIKSCRKYENPIEFQATHKLFMDCNHRPVVRGTDDAIWRRLKPVPFEVSIEETDPEYDKKLADKFKLEATGILAWAVRGCMAWLREGLGDTPEVGAANVGWREHDDPLKDFIDDCCVVEPTVWVLVSELAGAYAYWCRENHERFGLGREAFNERLASMGFARKRRRMEGGQQPRTWEGIMLRSEVATAVSREAAKGQGYLKVE